MNTLGERIYELRTGRGMSQGNLADSLDVSRQTVSKWENNQSIPELDRLIAMSGIFGVSVDYMVKGEAPTENAVVRESTLTETQPTVRTVKINNTKSYISGIAVSVSLIYLISVLLNIRVIVASVLHTAWSYNSIFSVIGMIIGVLSVAALLSQNRRILGASYALPLLTAIPSAILRGVSIGSVVLTVFYGTVVYLCFGASKKNVRPLCIFACLLLIASKIITLGGNAVNIYSVEGFTLRNTFLSVISLCISHIPSLIFHTGVCAVMYLRLNPLPDREIPEGTAERNGMYIPLVKHILLTLFTFGIYDCIWVCRTTETLNCDGVNERQSGYRKLLLCALVPFYRLYWYYAQSRRLERLKENEGGGTESFAAVTVILAVFLPVAVPGAFLQMKMNELAGK